MQMLPIGEFVFTIHAEKDSDERGGSSFQKAKGRGRVHVKCNSDTIQNVTLTVSLAGTDQRCTVRHNFSVGCICRLPLVFDFAPVLGGAASDCSDGFALEIEFACAKKI